VGNALLNAGLCSHRWSVMRGLLQRLWTLITAWYKASGRVEQDLSQPPRPVVSTTSTCIQRQLSAIHTLRQSIRRLWKVSRLSSTQHLYTPYLFSPTALHLEPHIACILSAASRSASKSGCPSPHRYAACPRFRAPGCEHRPDEGVRVLMHYAYCVARSFVLPERRN
jgi:hypothetical protein